MTAVLRPQVPVPSLRAYRTPTATVHLRRRWLVAAVVAFVIVLSFKLSGASGGAPASIPGNAGAASVYVVQPGDTLWSIAAALRPSVDTAVLVRQLVAANGGTTLQVGQRLRLP